ncbi:MAG: MiaB/RimO family radical SAM methylthiotransferase, partial [Lachnospiraceae bacterium]|nr:MiaB/RimO family radical SAM methylthiotransferase [Lachnospiraceae bacterium]
MILDFNYNEEELKQLEYIELLKEIVKEKEAKLGRKLTCQVTTFGCQMNARDSEKLLGILLNAGFVETEDDDADFVIYNTCTVRDNANQRVYGRLGALKSHKKKNKEMKIALCGCMTQEASVVEKLKQSYSFVDFIFGTHNVFAFAEYCVRMYSENKQIVEVWDKTDKVVEFLPVARKYSFKSGVNIMFGCNNFCTYCIVPYVRGRERSRSSEEIVCEIKNLVKDGVVEVMLLGQNVNSYGKGLEDEVSFPELLKKVEAVDGLERIRFMTSHPKDLSDELIEVMAESKKICRHIHLPLQSGSTEILKRMNRRYT